MTLRLLSSSIVFFSLIFLFSSCSSDRKKEAQQQQKGRAGQRPPTKADAYIVKTSMLTNSIEVPGTLVSNAATEIHPEVSGLITGIYFKEGGFVNKGVLLVKLNDADLQAQKRKLQIQLKVAKA